MAGPVPATTPTRWFGVRYLGPLTPFLLGLLVSPAWMAGTRPARTAFRNPRCLLWRFVNLTSKPCSSRTQTMLTDEHVCRT